MQVAAFVLFMVVCLFLGMGLFFPGLIFFIVGKKKQWKKGARIAFLAMTIAGALLIVAPLTFFGFIRSANGEPLQEDIFQKMGGAAVHQYEKIDGKWHDSFDFKDEHYLEIREEPFFDVELTNATSEKELTKDKAVLNIRPKGSLWRRIIFGANEELTLFQVDSDAGIVLLTDGDLNYCRASEYKKAKAFYTDFTNYQFYLIDEDDIDYSQLKEVALNGASINELKTLSKKNEKTLETGIDYDILCKSHDGAFECELILIKRKGDWYLQVGELGDDFHTETYAKLSADLANQIETALKAVE